MKRRLLATSHAGRYLYWLDEADLYVYQYDRQNRTWIGWLCAVSIWENVFSKSENIAPFTGQLTVCFG